MTPFAVCFIQGAERAFSMRCMHQILARVEAESAAAAHNGSGSIQVCPPAHLLGSAAQQGHIYGGCGLNTTHCLLATDATLPTGSAWGHVRVSTVSNAELNMTILATQHAHT